MTKINHSIWLVERNGLTEAAKNINHAMDIIYIRLKQEQVSLHQWRILEIVPSSNWIVNVYDSTGQLVDGTKLGGNAK